MAKVRLNPIIEGLHGRIGDMIFRGSNHGETVVYLAPDRQKSQASAEPDAQPHPFTNAHAFARAAMADPVMREHYEREARRTRKKAYSLAFASFFRVSKKLGE